MSELKKGEMTLEQVKLGGFDFVTLKEFTKKIENTRALKNTKDKYKTGMVAHYAQSGQVHWMKPERDRFIVMSPVTLEFMKTLDN